MRQKIFSDRRSGLLVVDSRLPVRPSLPVNRKEGGGEESEEPVKSALKV